MSYLAYQSYFKPDVDWLDEIPSHWEVRRSKTMIALQKSKVGKSASDHVLLSLTLGGVVPRDVSEGGKFPAEFDTYQVVEPHDLVFCLFDIDETPRTIGIARDDGMITGAYSVYRALGSCVPEYACYYFLHIDSFKGLRPFYTGLRKVVRADTFSRIEMPAPPVDEQTQIAKFLDYETAKIDALIEKQQQLIALLKEKRHAVISHAVTKGLNPDAPMRDSGVEWLGEVPAHWDVKHIKRLSPVKRGASPRPIDDQKYFDDDGEFAWTRIADVTASHMYLENSLQRLSDLGSSMSVKLEPGSLFLSIAGTVGKPCIAAIKACIHDGFVYFPQLKIPNKFLYYIFAGGQAYKGLGKMGTQLNLNTDTVGGIKIAVPPIEEIETIVAHLDQMTNRYGALIQKQEELVELVQERRTALISATVTGKIDVRGWKHPESESQTEAA